MSTAPLKIGIAGGGIAGLYCALKLDYQGFIEGALRSSESVIESIAMSTEVRHVDSSRAIAT